jgi:hypothetical protein
MAEKWEIWNRESRETGKEMFLSKLHCMEFYDKIDF